MDISVVIPTYYRSVSLKQLLESLVRQTCPRERFEVVVVLDGAQPETEQMLVSTSFDLQLRWYVFPHAGETTARNNGLGLAKAELVLFLDDDIVAGPELVAEHLNMHREHPGGVVLGALAIHPESPERFLGEVADFTVAVQQRCLEPGYVMGNADFLEGNFSVEIRHLHTIGGWDEHFADYGALDDLELGCRFLKHGFLLRFAPCAIAYHYYCKDLASLLQDNRRIGRAQIYYYIKHPDRVADLRFPNMIAGPWWKRWPLRLARVTPEWVFTLLASRLAPRLRRWNPRFGTGPAAFAVRAACGFFLARGLWDSPTEMAAAYRRFSTQTQ